MGKRKNLTALLLAVSLLWGCTAPGQTQETQPVEQTQPEETDSAITQNRTETFGLCYQSDAGFNPYSTTRLTNRTVMSLLYQGLFTVTAEYRAEPVLCRSFRHSDDLKTWIFTLEDATFSDGSALSAADVVASLQAAQGSAVYGNRLRHVTAITAGAGEVTITLDTAYENLPLLLDIPIVRAEDVAVEIPLGTGAYALSMQVLNSQPPPDFTDILDYGGWCLTRRSDWWSDYTPVVDLKSIPLTNAANPSEIRDEFEFGRTDLVCADPGASSYVEYRCDYELWECSTGIMLYLACNSEKGVFTNGNVRAALTYGVDRTALTELYEGFAREATLPADPESDCYDPVLAANYAMDTTKFRVTLSDSGAAGKAVTLLVNSDSAVRVEVAETLARQLTDGGLQVTVNAQPEDEFRRALRAGNYDLYLGEVRLSPNFDLSTFFAASGALNYGGMADGNLNNLCAMALENSGNYYDLFQSVMDDGSLCPLLFRTYAVFTTRGVLEGLLPAVDNVFHNANARQLSDAKTEWSGEKPTSPTETTETTEETQVP